MDGLVPFLGHALEIRRDPVDFLLRGRRRHGDVFGMKLPGADTVVFSGLKAHEAFFRQPDEVLSQKEVYQFMVPIFGKGIAYDTTPELMKEQMAFLHPGLREARLRTYAELFVEEAEAFFDRWDNEGVVDLYDIGNELTIYTSSRALLGGDFRKHLSGEFARLYQELEGGLTLWSFLNPYLPIPAHRRRDKARVKMGEMIKRIVDERRREGRQESDILQTLLEAKYSDGRALSDDEIVGILLTVMFAGHHTSGVTFCWNTILMNQHPAYFARVMEEQKAVLGDRTTLKVEDLRAMTLLERSVKETLRMYPAIIMLMRRVLKDFSYEQYEVKAGQMALCSPAASHHIETIFKDPWKYDPDRYGPGREEDRQHPLAFIAFGGGKHRCLGAVFATLQLVATSSVLARHFELELLEPRYYPDYKRILVGPHQPCRARYRRKKRPLVQVPLTSPLDAAPIQAAG
ncbi:MAG: cytochrome P450 [Deltaproteobacteria bacterium]|nr:cytochrome P450 [Deltaproteobacteria bacterium]